MKTIITTSLVTLTLFAGIASAQSPGALPPHDSNFAPAEDVSTLNGQLIPVGEKNRYRKSFRPFNVSLDPIGAVFGRYGASISYAPTSIFALRLDMNYWNAVDSDFEGVEFGISAPIYFRKMYSGVFLEPGLLYRSTSEEDEDDLFGGDDFDAFGPQVLLGYHWYWDNGLNVAMAAGFGRNVKSGRDDESNDIFGNAYLRIGYAF